MNLNHAMELTAKSIIDMERSSVNQFLTEDLLHEAQSIINNSCIDDIDEINDIFQGFFILKINNNKEITFESSCTKQINDDDKKIILNWNNVFDKKHTYINDYFRITLYDKILLFKRYVMGDSIVFIGNILSNTIKTKTNLVSIRQNNLMRNFL